MVGGTQNPMICRQIRTSGITISKRRFNPSAFYLTKSSARPFLVLAFESSADDTCAAVVSSNRDILSNVVIKQHDLHEGFGGIHPMVAIEAHQRNMPGAVQQAIKEAGISVNEVDGIAFTRGPGIGGCLSVGSNAAKTLAAALNKPVVGVHHMQAHALTPFLTSPILQLPAFPFLTLLVSGGHTLLLLATSLTSYRILATTPDESIGRSFDKVSRMLELKWTGVGPGAALEQFVAETCDTDMPYIPPPPRPMLSQLAFSFAGLHSFVERYIFNRGGIQNLDTPTRRALARAFQTAAVAQLEEKLLLALRWCAQRSIDVHHVVVSGGVASNSFLRTRLQGCLSLSSGMPISLVFPPPSLCTDNAAMIGWASMPRFLAHDYDEYTINLRPKWNIEELSP